MLALMWLAVEVTVTGFDLGVSFWNGLDWAVMGLARVHAWTAAIPFVAPWMD
jgi:hypothetical protein